MAEIHEFPKPVDALDEGASGGGKEEEIETSTDSADKSLPAHKSGPKETFFSQLGEDFPGQVGLDGRYYDTPEGE